MEGHVLSLLAAGLAALASTLLAVLLVQMRGQRSDTRSIGEKLDAHILEITRALALKVDSDLCKGTRVECIGLNHKIIKDPLQAQINEINRKRKERGPHRPRRTASSGRPSGATRTPASPIPARTTSSSRRTERR